MDSIARNKDLCPRYLPVGDGRNSNSHGENDTHPAPQVLVSPQKIMPHPRTIGAKAVRVGFLQRSHDPDSMISGLPLQRECEQTSDWIELFPTCPDMSWPCQETAEYISACRGESCLEEVAATAASGPRIPSIQPHRNGRCRRSGSFTKEARPLGLPLYRHGPPSCICDAGNSCRCTVGHAMYVQYLY